MTIESFPLHWPAGWPRTDKPKPSRFDTSQADAISGLLEEIRLLGGRDVILSTNQETYRRGGREIPYARQLRVDEDCGAAVYFNLNGEPRVFACDRWDRLQDNIQAIRKTIEALRGIERWGSSEMLDRIFTGFMALPETVSNNGRSWWAVLGFGSTGHDLVDYISAYKRLAKQAHPDMGGSDEAMAQLNWAIEQAKIAKGA